MFPTTHLPMPMNNLKRQRWW